jgi:hypothetical protein
MTYINDFIVILFLLVKLFRIFTGFYINLIDKSLYKNTIINISNRFQEIKIEH